MKLSEYIKNHYNGNITKFADDNEFYRQQVQEMLKKDTYHIIKIESKLMIVISKRKLIVDKLSEIVGND